MITLSDAENRRGDVVAALRSFADFLEATSEAPVPFAGVMQALLPGDWRMSEQERFAGVADLAKRLGAELQISSSGRAARIPFGAFEYIVHVNSDALGERAKEGESR